jgi:hypothetical protein
MGWYHYLQTEDGSPDTHAGPIACPDGTCRAPDPPTTATTTMTLVAAPVDEVLYHTATTPIYHLCQAKLWLQAIQQRVPYFPPSFWSDGRLTRASCDLETVLDTANHYYKSSSSGDWLCLQLDPAVWRGLGIPMAVQRAPEERSSSSVRKEEEEEPIQCLKVYGGISTTAKDVLVTAIYAMKRDNATGTFYGMEPDTSTPKRVVMDPPATISSLTKRTAAAVQKAKTRTAVDLCCSNDDDDDNNCNNNNMTERSHNASSARSSKKTNPSSKVEEAKVTTKSRGGGLLWWEKVSKK